MLAYIRGVPCSRNRIWCILPLNLTPGGNSFSTNLLRTNSQKFASFVYTVKAKNSRHSKGAGNRPASPSLSPLNAPVVCSAGVSLINWSSVDSVYEQR